ncbi:MAG: YkgJ family cysteine cluster protein, partial [Desulfosarcinaceae bacterium]
FDCHPGLACFNQCCRDLNQALTPYDTLRLRAYLELTAAAFRDKYLEIRPGPESGLPVATLRFSDHPQKHCPFVRAEGCLVYPARPASCRMYPLARALHRSRADGELREHFALLREPHCRGFEQSRNRTVRQWVINQELGIHLRINDALLELIALKNRLRPGPLSRDHWHWARMVFYDLDGFKRKVMSDDPATSLQSGLPHPPEAGAQDEAWLGWAMLWLKELLFGRF